MVGLLAAPHLGAQTAGTVMLGAGATKVQPNVKSGDLTPAPFPGAQIDLRSDTRVSGRVSYMLTDHVAIDLPLALPFRLDLVADGAIAGVGKIGEVRALPATLLGQYRFLAPTSPVRPYAGAGLSYVKFYKATGSPTLNALTGAMPGKPTSLSVDSKFAPTFQLGGTYAFADHWFVDANVTYTFLKTRASLSTGQTLELRVDPSAFTVGVGYAY